jgi:[ribosomal protein S18]-alanine N-acetyltransferase
MPKLTLRYMQLPDITQVVAIDQASFDPAWSARSYAYEISESIYSHMAVLERSDEQPVKGWRRWLSGYRSPSEANQQIVAYGGLWSITGEGHISTIASHPASRGNSYGEIVLAGMVRRALTLEAEYVVLEVRVSNTIAQKLYAKYEFKTVAVKPKYYRNNNEDAYDMRLDLSDEAMIARFDRRYSMLQSKQPFIDLYSEAQPPRKK